MNFKVCLWFDTWLNFAFFYILLVLLICGEACALPRKRNTSIPYFALLNAAHIKSERTCKILRVYLLSEVDVFAELRVLDSEKNTF